MPQILNAHSLSDLTIIGYADSLARGQGPHRVAPIFQFNATETAYLIPPYILDGTRIIDGHVIGQAELGTIVAEGHATLLDNPRSPVPNHDLWVDDDLNAQYAPHTDVLRELRIMARAALLEAERWLERGDAEKAIALAGRAFAADDTYDSALIVTAAAHCQLGDPDAVADIEMLAKEFMTTQEFQTRLNRLVSTLPVIAKLEIRRTSVKPQRSKFAGIAQG